MHGGTGALIRIHVALLGSLPSSNGGRDSIGLNPAIDIESGMKRVVLKVDSKGGIQIPKEVRDKLGIKNEVNATVEDGVITFEPVERILDRLQNEVKFNFRSVKESLPKLRKAAEKELFKQTSNSVTSNC